MKIGKIKDRKIKNGFTLLEILVSMAIVAIVGSIGLYLLSPNTQLARARNNQRTVAINAILTAVGQRIGDNKGKFETGCAAGVIPSTLTNIGNGSGKYNIESCLVPVYLKIMPYDPVGGTASDTKYQISMDANGGVTVKAPQAELNQTISATRF